MLNFGLELPRSVAEWGLFLFFQPLLHLAAGGDGHPVFVLPGFLGDDTTTLTLRWYLRRIGYQPHGWRLGRNVGPTKEVVRGIRDTLDHLAEEKNERVSVIGWSLGGVYARELGRTAADEVRQVITLASPFRLTDLKQTRTSRLYAHYSDRHDIRYRVPPYRVADEPLPVPSTAVYSRTDGIVSWRTCVQETSETAENIEVFGSHCGLGHNAAVIYAVVDRLAQPLGEWQPFKPPPPLRVLYPRPVTG
jgi:pimeloyl-ACP methyl ester carboxylesterase